MSSEALSQTLKLRQNRRRSTTTPNQISTKNFSNKLKMSATSMDLYMMEHSELNEEFRRITHLFELEKNKSSDAESRVLQLSKELEEMRLQLEKTISLKETYISQRTETQIKLDKVQDRHFSNELQTEKEKNKKLQEELNSIQNSQQVLKVCFESDILGAKQRVEKLKEQLDTDKKSHVDKVFENQQLLNKQRFELDALRQKMVLEKTSLQQTLQEKQNHSQRELEKIKASYQELSSRYEHNLAAVNQQAVKLQQDLHKQVNNKTLTLMTNQQLIKNIRTDKDVIYQAMAQEINALKLTSVVREMQFQAQLDFLKGQKKKQVENQLRKEIPPEKTNKSPSFWKRIKLFFGFKKT